jgi:hypothetical protein
MEGGFAPTGGLGGLLGLIMVVIFAFAGSPFRVALAKL